MALFKNEGVMSISTSTNVGFVMSILYDVTCVTILARTVIPLVYTESCNDIICQTITIIFASLDISSLICPTIKTFIPRHGNHYKMSTLPIILLTSRTKR